METLRKSEGFCLGNNFTSSYIPFFLLPTLIPFRLASRYKFLLCLLAFLPFIFHINLEFRPLLNTDWWWVHIAKNKMQLKWSPLILILLYKFCHNDKRIADMFLSQNMSRNDHLWWFPIALGIKSKFFALRILPYVSFQPSCLIFYHILSHLQCSHTTCPHLTFPLSKYTECYLTINLCIFSSLEYTSFKPAQFQRTPSSSIQHPILYFMLITDS